MKQESYAELYWGNFLEWEGIEHGGERVWVLTLKWVSMECFLNVEYIDWI